MTGVGVGIGVFRFRLLLFRDETRFHLWRASREERGISKPQRLAYETVVYEPLIVESSFEKLRSWCHGWNAPRRDNKLLRNSW